MRPSNVTRCTTAPEFARLLGDRQCGLAHLRADWLSSESAKFICNVIEHFGRPTAPVCVRIPPRATAESQVVAHTEHEQ
jgi:hypothetical protein